MSAAHRLVIVGNGMAGARLAENVIARQGTSRFDIVVFGDEEGGTYNRILLPGVLAGSYGEQDVVTNPAEWYATQGIRLHAGVRVQRIDLAARHVIADGGLVEPFDSLVLATGSRPILPSIDHLADGHGRLKDGAFVFRTLGDCTRMARTAATSTAAVVVGGGLLGLEAARALLNHGLPVNIVHLAGHVMEAQLDTTGGGILARQLQAMGLEILTRRKTTAVLGSDRVRGVQFSDGTTVPCDLLVIAAGVRPDTELARRAGLTVQRGIVVGDDLACIGTHGVYAIGDCAEHRDRVYGLVAPAWEQADVLADRLTGRRGGAVYTGTRLATKLKVAGVDVAVMGERDAHADDEVVSYAEPSRGIYSKLIVRDDRVTGAILIGAASAVPSVVQRFLDCSPVPRERSELLFPPTGDAPARAVDQIPDTARICDCNAVAKGDIVEAVLSGARSLRAVCERTRAGTGCGSCRPEVQRIVDFTCRSVEAAPALAAGGDDPAEKAYASA